MNAGRFLVGVVVWCLAAGAVVTGLLGADPPAKDPPPAKDKPTDEPDKLGDAIEKSVSWYDVFPDADAATPLKPTPVIRWRNLQRRETGGAILVVWPHNGRPVAMCTIYVAGERMIHEFDSLSRGAKAVAREKERDIWAPKAAGVAFSPVPAAPKPAKTPAERLRQMKAITERVKATMTGWREGDQNQDELRLLPRPLYRYDLTGAKDPDPPLLDGGMFAYVQGTDPEAVLILEAVGTADKAEWQYALVRATSAGLEVRLDKDVVWTAERLPINSDPERPHFTIGRFYEKD